MPRSTPFATALLLAVLPVPLGAAEPAVLKSPTGKVEVSFSLAEDATEPAGTPRLTSLSAQRRP